MKKVKNECLFVEFYDGCYGVLAPSDHGRKQFFEDQSIGKKPENPEIYYLQLSHGKRMFDLQCSSMKDSFFTKQATLWPGLILLGRDWKGKKWVLKYLLKWHPKCKRYERYKDPK